MKTMSRLTIATIVIAMVIGIAGMANAALIGFNAEDGSSATATVNSSLGAKFDPPLDNDYALGGSLIATEDNADTGGYPGSADYVASYEIGFPEAGTYDLYARLGILDIDDTPANDDSFYYGNGFGSKGVSTDADWKTVQLIGAGGDSIDENTQVGADTWFWINLSEWDNNPTDTPITFTIGGADPLTQTFQMGGREDGLRMDAFAFGTSTETYTDEELDTSVIPEPVSSLLFFSAGGLLWFVRRRLRA